MYYPTLSIALISVSVILPTLAFTAVGLRVKARRVKETPLNASDYIIFLACFVCLGQLIVGIVGGTIGGMGRPLSSLDAKTSVIFTKVLFIMQFFHHFAVFFIKVSLVLFYKSIFPNPKFNIAANIINGVLVAWIIAFFFGTLFQDKPISRNWGTNGTTINYPLFYTIENCTDIVLDIVILCMPLPVIKSLHMNEKKKWLLGGVFSLGFFCVVAGVVRLYYLVKFDKQYTASRLDPFSFSTVNYMIWNTVEPCASIVTACLPTYITLLRGTRAGAWIRSIASGVRDTLTSRRKYPSHSNPKPKKPPIGSFTDLIRTGDESWAGKSGFTQIETPQCEVIEMSQQNSVAGGRDEEK